ncbi:WD40-repeat-containing domain protein [Spinellus fusiger]|nr:WD40-repeat-containing domain protein [Spinellus fusiger]
MSLSPMTPLQILVGHKAPVVCLHHAKDSYLGEHLLASGSEDATCRLWDLRLSKAVKGIQGFDSPVSSVSFARQSSLPHFYLASGTKVFTYDLRNTSMILTQAEREYHFSKDEINTIDINEKNTFLATADDDGQVTIVDLTTHKIYKPFSKKHRSICMVVQFRPKKPWQVWSGGLDNKVLQWDFSRGSILSTYDTNPKEPSAEHMFNPPFVYCLAISTNGQRIAAGLGDTTVQVLSFDPAKKSKHESPTVIRLEEGHASMISSLTFLSGTDHDLLSGASNGSLARWTLLPSNEQAYELKQTSQLDSRFVKLNWLTSMDTGSGPLVAAAGVGVNNTAALAVYSL